MSITAPGQSVKQVKAAKKRAKLLYGKIKLRESLGGRKKHTTIKNAASALRRMRFFLSCSLPFIQYEPTSLIYVVALGGYRFRIVSLIRTIGRTPASVKHAQAARPHELKAAARRLQWSAMERHRHLAPAQRVARAAASARAESFTTDASLVTCV